MHFLAVLCKTNHPPTETATVNYLNFHLELNAACLPNAEVDSKMKHMQPSAKFSPKIEIVLIDVFLGVAVLLVYNEIITRKLSSFF